MQQDEIVLMWILSNLKKKVYFKLIVHKSFSNQRTVELCFVHAMEFVAWDWKREKGLGHKSHTLWSDHREGPSQKLPSESDMHALRKLFTIRALSTTDTFHSLFYWRIKIYIFQLTLLIRIICSIFINQVLFSFLETRK